MRNKKIIVAALNITMHPHSPEKYYQLLSDVRRMELKKPYRGNNYGMIGLMDTLEAEEEITETTEITGLIYRFLQFDPDEPWLNFREGKQAEPNDLAAVQIPDHLRPGYARFHFLFFPSHHRLFFETRTEKDDTFSPGLMRVLVEKLLNDSRLQEKYGPVDVTVEPTMDALDRIFSMPHLSRLEMRINRPNPDTGNDELEKEVFGRLDNQNADREEIKLTATLGKSLQPDGDTKSLAVIAQNNGYVKASGRDENNIVTDESTEQHPWKEPVSYNPNLTTAADTLRGKAYEMLQKIKNRLR